jgi:tRNA (guanine37-N1)-methyltransferase
LQEAEVTRRRLAATGVLRTDLEVRKDEMTIVFPVTEGSDMFDFQPRQRRARAYTDLLPAELRAAAPRAFDTLGDIVVVKVPQELWPRRAEIGQALLEFAASRAVFHDAGVEGTFRTRRLERIAGRGGSETVVQENGVTLHVDPAVAYFSPRLAAERARIAAMVEPGEAAIDLFGGVAPQGVQLAKAGAEVSSVDLNPDAVRLARRNAAANGVTLQCIEGDARAVSLRLPLAQRVIMNLPHGAREFLDVGAGLTRPGGMLHHHEILADADVAARPAQLVAILAAGGRRAVVETVRHVRAYSAREGHYVFDVRLA